MQRFDFEIVDLVCLFVDFWIVINGIKTSVFSVFLMPICKKKKGVPDRTEAWTSCFVSHIPVAKINAKWIGIPRFMFAMLNY